MAGFRPDGSRYIYLYCSSPDQKKKFQELANKAGAPLSKFLLSVIEKAISQQARAVPRERVSENTRALEDELQKLREESRLNEKLLKKYEAENRRLGEAWRLGRTTKYQGSPFRATESPFPLGEG